MDIQVILSDEVPGLGKMGDVVKVAGGYARNFLIPRQLAMLASTKNIAQLEHTKRQIAKKQEKLAKSARDLASQLTGVSVTISKAVGAEDRLFGSVTNRDIEDALTAEGYKVDRRHIKLAEPIKNLGIHNVDIKLHGDVHATVKVFVVADA